ncbi:Copia protein [Araneus ventricosus]|uniref:Copia protein n=1 Tax=Araneus ventricosus TaxID=182803 RepID=A0A4Y2WX35_ARAVE|nr:Copia protein [Araneus ventricosus]
MSKNNSVKGIEHLSKSKVENCVNCKIAKSTRSSLKKNYTYRRTTQRCLDRVHCDLWGPAPVTSIGGNRYFLSIIDDYSRKVDVYIIKSKDQVFDCFKKYLAQVERELNSKIKCMRSDNGLEFCHKEFENFLTKLGIKMERTSLYTPEQNGIAEKFNRTAMDGIRAMLHDSGLQPKFWAEALLTFVHAKNRCEHKLTSPLTPTEIWSGFKPSVRHFRIFGSLAYVHIPKIKRNKFQLRAKLGILVGYSLRTKGYRVFLPNENKVIETIHVYIDESKNGVRSLFGKNKQYEYAKFNLNSVNEFEDLDDSNRTKLLDKLSPLDIEEWTRKEYTKTRSKQMYVYYCPPSSKTKLKSLNEVRKYCKENKMTFEPEKFNFKATTKYSDKNKNSENDSRSEGSNSDEIYETLEYECYNSELPKTFEDTQRSKDKEKWDFAMREELNMMKTRKVWELVDPPANKTIIGSKWVYNIKHDEENKPKKYKARLVALGFKQKAGIDYGETFSPVVNFSIVKLMFIVLVSLLGWNHVQLDVKSAYLYGKLNEKVYLKQPPGFIVKDAESKVYLLLHQSGRSWNCELDHILKNLKFDKLLWSNCLYKNKDVILVIYVDDIIVFSKTLNGINKTIALIKSKFVVNKFRDVLKIVFNTTYTTVGPYVGDNRSCRKGNEISEYSCAARWTFP